MSKFAYCSSNVNIGTSASRIPISSLSGTGSWSFNVAHDGLVCGSSGTYQVFYSALAIDSASFSSPDYIEIHAALGSSDIVGSQVKWQYDSDTTVSQSIAKQFTKAFAFGDVLSFEVIASGGTNPRLLADSSLSATPTSFSVIINKI